VIEPLTVKVLGRASRPLSLMIFSVSSFFRNSSKIELTVEDSGGRIALGIPGIHKGPRSEHGLRIVSAISIIYLAISQEPSTQTAYR
jgi:hypothetical protein